jgi:hypothetical protein
MKRIDNDKLYHPVNHWVKVAMVRRKKLDGIRTIMLIQEISKCHRKATT